jgi:ribosomal protein S18 acetylase RimI-like enzyme
MVTASTEDMAEISSILLSSFEDNKSITYLVPEGPGKKHSFHCLIQYSISTCLEFGKVVLSDDRRACALVLFPDRKRFTFSALSQDLKLVWQLGWSSALRGMKREALVKERHPKTPLYYLWYIGVHPDQQGEGYGTALMQELITDARAMGRQFVLETSTVKNIPWYQNLGFQIYDQLDLGYPLTFLKHQS